MSKYGYKVRKGIKDVVVIFSSVDVPFGKFSATWAVNELTSTIIYVNCTDNSWYLEGIIGLGVGIDRASKELNKLVHKYLEPSGSVLYYGGSMGGYGALLYGCINDAHFIIATGVELNLSKKNGYFKRFSKLSLETAELRDVKQVVEQSSSEVFLLFGEGAIEDHIELETLSSINHVQIVSIPNCSHSVPVMLNRFFGLSTLFKHTLEGRGKNIFDKVAGKLSKNLELTKLFMKAEEAPTLQLAKTLECEASQIVSESLKSYCFYYASLVYFKLSDIIKAQEFCDLSIFWNGNYIKPLQLRLRILETLDEQSEYVRSFDKLLAIHSSNPTDSEDFLLLQYAEGCYKLNMKDKCKIIIDKLDSKITCDNSRPISLRFNKLKSNF
jgi:hypothetical protein